MRANVLGISVVVHVVAGCVLAWLAPHAAPPERSSVTTIELLDGAPPLPPAPPVTGNGQTLGGGHGAQVATVDPPARRSPSPRAVRAARGEVAVDDRARHEEVTEGDPRGELRIEAVPGDVGIDAGAVGDGAGEGDGHGTGRGRGTGRGIGLGDGAQITDDRVAIETPAPPPASKARTATLVYPVRQRQVDDGELFVARVTIDRDGYVVGARLVRGFGGPRDAMAADLIWKFRYAPALDDDGNPITSSFDQRFLVER